MKIFILNATKSGTDTIRFISKELELSGVIGLSDRTGKGIAGFCYNKDFTNSLNIPFYEVQSYSLSYPQDIDLLKALPIDLLIVTGWQRLIPEWLITHCKIGVIGLHGSPFGITKGRGRSPQNWAIILGETEFNLSIFFIDEGIDSGKIIDSKTFKISLFDDIKTSYKKSCLAFAELLLKNIKNEKIKNKDQLEIQNGEAEYFPQRKPEDGLIDWNRSEFEIFNFIKALTRPYPGAATLIEGKYLIIWEAIPFEYDFPDKNIYIAGEIVRVFSDESFIVKCYNGFLLALDYEFRKESTQIKKGKLLESANFHNQINRIMERHYKKYPNLQISRAISELEDDK